MRELVFGAYRLIPERRQLLLDGRKVPLRSRPFDILVTLVQRHDQVVTKDELIREVWPGRVVEECNLSVYVASLRKLLGAGVIATLSGRGYRFVAPVEEVAAESIPTPSPLPAPQRSSTNLPVSLLPMIGRDDAVTEVISLLDLYRLVTLTGVGGIGKTRLALAAALRLLPLCPDGVWLVDLGPLSDGALVPSAIASVLGLHVTDRASLLENIARALCNRKVLLVLDNCEHLLDASATVAEALLRSGNEVRILATSREPLRAEGECLYRVQPLDIPEATVQDTNELLYHSAVRLFVSLAARSGFRVQNDTPTLQIVGSICRHLDGIPLAIELAAARVATLGIDTLNTRLNDRFELLKNGRRTALLRHQTLRAALNWSFELLSETERVVLRRLSVFVGGFEFDAAVHVGAGADMPTSEVMNAITNLVAKSLVTMEVVGQATRYRLLETTRVYGLEKLTESGETPCAARWHAEYYKILFAPSEGAKEALATFERIDIYRVEIDNVRAALDWAFSDIGDTEIGIALTAAYLPVWLHMSLISECLERAERALQKLDANANLSTRLMLQLHVTLGLALVYAAGPLARTELILKKALELAESLGDPESRLQALWAMQICRLNYGEIGPAQSIGERFLDIARLAGDPVDIGGGHRLIGGTLHYGGRQREAHEHLVRAVELNIGPSASRHVIWGHYDQHVIARSRLARVLWLQGYTAQAAEVAHGALSEAQGRDHKLSICFALGEAVCLIGMMTGDLDVAERSLEELIELSTRHNFNFWKRVANCLKGQLLICRGVTAVGAEVLRSAIEDLTSAALWLYYPRFIGVLAEATAALGNPSEGLIAINDALARANACGVRWYVPEFLRLRGELALNIGKSDAIPVAEKYFFDALAEARRQGALTWELRSAMSLARFRIQQQRRANAAEILLPVYRSFSEGFNTADLRAAKIMLDDLKSRVDGPG
jgi:predicted ATPase/DNA-binding winged helix-turn-helix (wHTH) protein